MYFGTKQIKAQAMTRQEYNDYRGWELPEDEDGTDTGFLVEYVDGGAANHPDHEGYISWSPSGVFNASYQADGCLSFGHALMHVKNGGRAARSGWNGDGMFIFLVNGSQFKVNREPLVSILGEGIDVTYRPHIDISNPDGTIATWSPSNGDALADDWFIVE